MTHPLLAHPSRTLAPPRAALHRPSLRTALPIALVLTLGACGGGDDGSSSANTPSDPTSAITRNLQVAGPIAVTATSYPFARARNVDLAARGFEELEYFVTGKANIYQWSAANTAEVRTPDAPYTNRIIVIRPKDPSKANGKVMVDILNATVGWDFNKNWAVMHDHLLEDGWTYIGVTSKSVTAAALKTFDPERYKSISWQNPLAVDNPANCAVAAPDKKTTENGLLWDILTHVGALARSKEANSPFRNYTNTQVYLTGFSQSGGNLHTYANAFHGSAKLADGRPVYDGYLQVAPIGSTPLNQCDTTVIAPSDPRARILPRSVPLITVVGAKDVLTYIVTYNRRRDDSDVLADRYRLYEVPGGSHSWTKQLGFNVDPADVLRTGNTNPNVVVPANCTLLEANDFPMHFVMNAALDSLDKWARGVAVPARVARIDVDISGATPAYVYDENMNLKGGYRTPYVDVPAAAYLPTNAPACTNWGHVERFTPEKLRALYVNQGSYVSKVYTSTADLVAKGLLTAADGQRVLNEAAALAF